MENQGPLGRARGSARGGSPQGPRGLPGLPTRTQAALATGTLQALKGKNSGPGTWCIWEALTRMGSLGTAGPPASGHGRAAAAAHDGPHVVGLREPGPKAAQPPPRRSLTCAHEGPGGTVTARPAGGLRELVGRHPVKDASDAAVASVPPPRGAGLCSPTPGCGAQAIQHQRPAETEKCPVSPAPRACSLSPTLPDPSSQAGRAQVGDKSPPPTSPPDVTVQALVSDRVS